MDVYCFSSISDSSSLLKSMLKKCFWSSLGSRSSKDASDSLKYSISSSGISGKVRLRPISKTEYAYLKAVSVSNPCSLIIRMTSSITIYSWYAVTILPKSLFFWASSKELSCPILSYSSPQPSSFSLVYYLSTICKAHSFIKLWTFMLAIANCLGSTGSVSIQASH